MIVGALVAALALAAGAYNMPYVLGWAEPAARGEVAGASVELHYAPDENLEPIDVVELDAARATIDISAYVLTDGAVIGALARAGQRGVDVRVWRDPEQAARTSDYDIVAKLGAEPEGIQIRTKSGGGALMHLKGYCVDGKVLRTGSANFSRSGLRDQDNDLVIVRSPEACARFETKFTKAWGPE
jgi:phosphatidylserine/phosphatidylglycerophosphate/cardiolipin synthase-like enzyme